MAHRALQTRPRRHCSTSGSIAGTVAVVVRMQAAGGWQMYPTVKRRRTSLFEAACTVRAALAVAGTVGAECAG